MLDPNKPPLTLGELAQRSFHHHAGRPCLGTKSKSGKAEDGTPGDGAVYTYATYAAIAQRVRHAACGLMSLGLGRGDRAAILAENRPEWAIADLACQMLGVISVPLFPTLPPGQVSYILRDSGAALVFVSTTKQLQKIAAIIEPLPDLRHVVTMDALNETETVDGTMTDAAPESRGLAPLHIAQLESNGEEYARRHPTEFEATWPAAAAEDVATIIYTSGTTGEPKGVMLTHRNIISNLEAIIELHDWSSEGVFLSFLPLAHVYERTAGYYLPLRIGAAIAYCESLFTVDKNLREAEPHIMFCVARLLETMRDKIQGAGAALPPGKREKYADALRLAQKAGAHRGGVPGAPSLGLGEQLKYRLYEGAVYSKIRDKFGGRLQFFVAGGAALPPDVGALFLGLGIPILEGYGLTETSPIIAVNRPGRVRLGTVGEVVSSVEVKIADDGEILARGASVMKGYWNKPQETKTAIDAEGWFHTGDIGALRGAHLAITDRKKDLLVLSNGKKVAPAPIEMKLMQSPYIAQPVLLGDSHKAVVALVVPRLDALREWAKTQNIEADSDEELLRAPAVTALMRSEIDRLSDDLADFEKIRKIVLLPQAFTVEGGELTPTLKVKRKAVAEKYAALLGEA